jgi:hypothetical protein
MRKIIYAVTLRDFLCETILNLSRSLSSAKSEPLFVFCFNYIIDRFLRMCDVTTYVTPNMSSLTVKEGETSESISVGFKRTGH